MARGWTSIQNRCESLCRTISGKSRVCLERRREQYFGDALLAFLREKQHSIRGTLLGLIDQDCYTGNLGFILGQAVLKGHEAIVATKRLRQSFYGFPENPGLLRERLLKEAMHEIGHTWGLPHCPDSHCVMHFSSSLNDTDIKEAKYCDHDRWLIWLRNVLNYD